MNKEELLNQLNHTKNNFIIGLAALSIFKSGQAIPLLERHAAAFGDYTVTFDQVAELLRKTPDRGIALSEYNKMLIEPPSRNPSSTSKNTARTPTSITGSNPSHGTSLPES